MKSTEKEADCMNNSSAGSTQAGRNTATETSHIENNNVEQLLTDLEKLKHRTISKETMNFIVCLEMADMLFNQFSHAVEMYHNTDEIIDDIFCPAYKQVEGVIEKYLAQSIRENLIDSITEI
ncbi:MAG: hypothetical protein LBK94_05250 [Prevotellaceae bacterium]|jgi:hypothetical protein|nr:hypothetical protein [Prevotellaceae bacterium]